MISITIIRMRIVTATMIPIVTACTVKNGVFGYTFAGVYCYTSEFWGVQVHPQGVWVHLHQIAHMITPKRCTEIFNYIHSKPVFLILCWSNLSMQSFWSTLLLKRDWALGTDEVKYNIQAKLKLNQVWSQLLWPYPNPLWGTTNFFISSNKHHFLSSWSVTEHLYWSKSNVPQHPIGCETGVFEGCTRTLFWGVPVHPIGCATASVAGTP